MNPTNDQLIDALAEFYGTPRAVVLSWLIAMFVRFDPKAEANRLAEREAQCQSPS